MPELIGKIITAHEAEKEFGSVTRSYELNNALLTDLANEAGEKIMFRFYTDFVAVLGTGRRPLYPSGFQPEEGDEFRVFSSLLITELINKGGSETCFAELRGDTSVFCIRNKDLVLEYGYPCPPFC